MRKNIEQQLIVTRALLGHKLGFLYKIDSTQESFILGRRTINPFYKKDSLIDCIDLSLAVVWSTLERKGHILIVNTNSDISPILYHFASQLTTSRHLFSFSTEKWAGGLLTNWSHIKKSIKSYLEFSTRFGPYLVNNNIHYPRFKKMKQLFHGFTRSFEHASFAVNIANQKQQYNLQRPSLVIIINPSDNMDAVKEAKSLNIPLIAFADTRFPLTRIGYPIPVNGEFPAFTYYYLSLILKMISYGDRIKFTSQTSQNRLSVKKREKRKLLKRKTKRF